MIIITHNEISYKLNSVVKKLNISEVQLEMIDYV